MTRLPERFANRITIGSNGCWLWSDIDERHPDWLYGRVAELEREANE